MSMNLKDDRVKSDKFRRDGAKYVCVKCKTKYFGKEEVERCFDAHAAEEAKKVGYSVTSVDGASLTQARETNLINSLTGRVAGLNISSLASGPAGSSRITLRGNTSISGGLVGSAGDGNG